MIAPSLQGFAAKPSISDDIRLVRGLCAWPHANLRRVEQRRSMPMADRFGDGAAWLNLRFRTGGCTIGWRTGSSDYRQAKEARGLPHAGMPGGKRKWPIFAKS
jgi:hypothetical protein